MKTPRLLPILAALEMLSACAVPRKPAPATVLAPPPRAVATPLPAAPPPDWRDAALTPGNWTYDTAANGSSARFGLDAAAPLASLRCDRAAGRIALQRAGTAAGPVPLTVTTSTITRAFTATPITGATPQLGLALGVRDPVLDAIAFSRGRFVIEVAGLPTLYLPAWPEVARVVEDCR